MKYLIVGGGSIAKRHIKNLHSLGVDEIHCLKRQYDNSFEKEFQCSVITSWEEAKKISPNIVFACNPTALHFDVVEFAEQIKAHLFMEKPLTHSEGTLEKIKNSWTSNQVFFIGFMLRYHPLLQTIKTMLQNNIIGDIYYARFEFGSYLPGWHPGEDYKSGYAARKDLGGGVINTISHELDMMLFLLGEPNSVTAIAKNTGVLDIEVEEIADAVFEYPFGLAHIHLDYLQKEYDRQIKILGTKGKITWNWHDNSVDVKKVDEKCYSIPMDSFIVNQLYLDEVKDFIKKVNNGTIKHDLDFDTAVTNSHWILSMHSSIENQNKCQKS